MKCENKRPKANRATTAKNKRREQTGHGERNADGPPTPKVAEPHLVGTQMKLPEIPLLGDRSAAVPKPHGRPLGRRVGTQAASPSAGRGTKRSLIRGTVGGMTKAEMR